MKSIIKPGMILFGVLIILIAIVVSIYALRLGNDAEVRTKQTEALANSSIQSAEDAVNTLEMQLTNEQAAYDELKEVTANVEEAPNGHSAHTAGSSWLCREYKICSSDN